MTRRLPELSFSVRHSDDTLSGDLSLDSIGFGIHQCWIYATMFGNITLFQHQNLYLGVFGANISLQFLVSISVLTFVLLAIGLFGAKKQDLICSNPVKIGGALLTGLASLLLLMPTQSYDTATNLEIISGVITALGSAVLLINWGVRFSKKDVFSIALNSIIAICFAYFLYSFVLVTIPSPAGAIIACALPLAQLPILLSSSPSLSLHDSRKQLFEPLPVNMKALLVLFGLPMLVFGAAMGLLRNLSIQHASVLSAQYSVTAITFAIAIMMVRVMAFPPKHGQWQLDFRGLVPLIAIAIVLVPTAASEDAELFSALILITYLCFETLTWAYFGEISQAFRISPITVFGIGRGLVALGTICSSLLIVNSQFSLSGFGGEESLVLLLVLTLVIAFTMLPTKRSFKDIVVTKNGPQPREPFDFDDEDSIDPIVALNDSKPENPLKQKRVETATEIAPASKDAPKKAESKWPVASEAKSEAIAENPTKRKGWFRKKCEAASNMYMLSAREEEVLFCLAKGFNASHIQEKLFISEGTAKTHMRHIYRKLNVHSQQALIRLVESMEIDEDF